MLSSTIVLLSSIWILLCPDCVCVSSFLHYGCCLLELCICVVRIYSYSFCHISSWVLIWLLLMIAYDILSIPLYIVALNLFRIFHVLSFRRDLVFIPFLSVVVFLSVSFLLSGFIYGVFNLHSFIILSSILIWFHTCTDINTYILLDFVKVLCFV